MIEELVLVLPNVFRGLYLRVFRTGKCGLAIRVSRPEVLQENSAILTHARQYAYLNLPEHIPNGSRILEMGSAHEEGCRSDFDTPSSALHEFFRRVDKGRL